jgi:predicted Zn finger-like uncharacterized protein
MDVKCNKCGAEYSLDETLVAATGTPVRCTNCGHVFKAYRPETNTTESDEWLLRQVGGSTFSFERLGILQDWIAKDKVSENDLLSRSGGPWKQLADIPELQPFFAKIPSYAPPAAGFPRTEDSAHTETIRESIPKQERVQTIPQVPVTQDELDSGARSQTVKFDRPSTSSANRQNPSRFQNPPMAVPTSSLGAPVAPRNPVGTAPASSQPVPQTAQPVVQQTVPTQPGTAQSPVAQPQNEPSSPAFEQTIPTQSLQEQPVASPPAGQPETAQPQAAPTPATPHPESLTNAINVSEPDLSQIPATDKEEWDSGEEMSTEEPAWAEKNNGVLRYDDDDDEFEIAPRRKIGRWIALVVIVVIVGGSFYVFQFQPKIKARITQVLGGLLNSPDDSRYIKFFDHGRESFLLDSNSHYHQADREFQKVLALEESHVPTLAALAELYAVWAQYLYDDQLDAKADAGEAEESDSEQREATRLSREFDEKLGEAARWAEQAIEADPKLPVAQRAMADVRRLQGKLEQAKEHIKKAQAGRADPETDYVNVLIDFDSGTSVDVLVGRLQKIIAKKPLIRAMYRRARMLASLKKSSDSKQMLAKLFDLNSDHLRGRDLAARIDEEKPVALSIKIEAEVEATQDAGPPEDAVAVAPPTEDEEEVPSNVAQPSGSPGHPPRVAGGSGGGGGGGGGGSIDAMLSQAGRLQENGNTSGATALFEKVLDRSPSNIDALAGLAYCYLDRGSSGQAIAHFRRALKVNPSYGPAQLGLAETFKGSGQKEQSLKYYRQYLSSHPSGRQADLARRNIELMESSVRAANPEGEDKEEKVDQATPASSTTSPSPATNSPTNDDTPGTPPTEKRTIVISPPADSTSADQE